MRVLVCGSSGCVGRAVVAALRWRGHRVVETRRSAPDAKDGDAMALDFMRPTDPALWASTLSAARVDAVVNCVGILVPSANASFARIHHAGPAELFRGAARAGVGRIVQVSALGVGALPGDAHEPEYLRSKRLADETLLDLAGVDAAVVRPSLVYGPGSQSARLFATLAGLPVISLPGRGKQRVQPLHVFELAEAIAALVERTGASRGIYELGGDAALSYREMLATYRRAQGLGDALWLPMPMPLMRLGAVVAERLPQQVFCRDTLSLLERGNTTSRNASRVLLGRAPASLAEGLAATPPEPMIDLRVRLAAPMELALRLSLAFLWLYTALVSAAMPERSGVLDLLAHCGFAGTAGWAALVFSCALNVSLGLATLLRPGVRLYAVQAAAVVGYTLTAALNVPALTIDHCGPLAKNVPLLMCIVTLWLAAASSPARRGPQTSMLATRSALLSMKWRRGSTSSPISIVKTRSASIASSS